MNQLNEVGETVFNVMYGASYWVIAIIGVKEVLKAGVNHDIDGVIKALTAVGVSYAGIYGVTIVLDMVREVMSK